MVEPESLDMKTRDLMGICVPNSFWAVMIGPIVFVCKCVAKSPKDLMLHKPQSSGGGASHAYVSVAL